MVEKINVKQFNQMIQDPTSPLVIDCYADWCMPCKYSSPHFEAMSKQFTGRARFKKVNVDEQPQIANAFRVTGVPSFVIMRGKKVVHKVVGADLKKLEAKLNQELKEFYAN